MIADVIFAVGGLVYSVRADEQIKQNKESIQKLEQQSDERGKLARDIDENLKFLIQELQIRGVIGQSVRTESASEAPRGDQ